MDMLILKTNINSKYDFQRVECTLNNTFNINECTVDLDDIDKVLRITGRGLNIEDVVGKVKELGYSCEDLPN